MPSQVIRILPVLAYDDAYDIYVYPYFIIQTKVWNCTSLLSNELKKRFLK